MTAPIMPNASQVLHNPKEKVASDRLMHVQPEKSRKREQFEAQSYCFSTIEIYVVNRRYCRRIDIRISPGQLEVHELLVGIEGFNACVVPTLTVRHLQLDKVSASIVYFAVQKRMYLKNILGETITLMPSLSFTYFRILSFQVPSLDQTTPIALMQHV